MPISSVMKISLTSICFLAMSLVVSAVSYAGDLTRSSRSQILPTASFAPANVQIPQDNMSPVVEHSPDRASITVLSPLLTMENVPAKKQAKVAYKRARKAFKKGDFEQIGRASCRERV